MDLKSSCHAVEIVDDERTVITAHHTDSQCVEDYMLCLSDTTFCTITLIEFDNDSRRGLISDVRFLVVHDVESENPTMEDWLTLDEVLGRISQIFDRPVPRTLKMCRDILTNIGFAIVSAYHTSVATRYAKKGDGHV